MGFTQVPRHCRFGVFEADLRAGGTRSMDEGSSIRIAFFAALTLAAHHPGEVITREDFRRALWPRTLLSILNKDQQAVHCASGMHWGTRPITLSSSNHRTDEATAGMAHTPPAAFSCGAESSFRANDRLRPGASSDEIEQ